MNLKFLKVKALLVAVILSSVFVSCTKEDEKQVKQTELTKAEVDEIISFNPLKGLFIHDELRSNKYARRGGDNSTKCNLLKSFKLENGKIKYDFGGGCELFGRTYKGKLIVEHKLRGLGFEKFVEYDGFVSDGIEISGKVAYIATAKDKETGHLLGSVNSELTVTLLKDGTKFTKIAKISFEKVAGNETLLKFADDVYEIKGEWSAAGFKNHINHSIKITKPLKRKSLLECLHTSAGTIEIQKGSKKHILDFGNGECDSKVTLDGKEYSL
ncbi:MAG: hypothetical protein KGV44_01885 [Flavobacteriaceae bacterium]|nr:hypothetical protein [Flavobacteriaceae bacterium]